MESQGWQVSLVTRDIDITAKVGKFDVRNSREEKLLGIKIDIKLSFENRVSSLCKKASQKFHAIKRVVNFVDLAKRKNLMKAFITCQFSYCPLFGINKIRGRALRLVYKDSKLTFNDLLELNNSVTIHQRNLRISATEIFKVKSLLESWWYNLNVRMLEG